MVHLATAGYTADDLDRLRRDRRRPTELDPWGGLIASRADHIHEGIAMAMARQATEQLFHPVSINRFPPIVPGGIGHLMVPDLLVLTPAGNGPATSVSTLYRYWSSRSRPPRRGGVDWRRELADY